MHMTSKEYETLLPIPSQAERDLSFLDASVEVTDFSSSRHLKTTKRLRKRPWFGFKMNTWGRTIQASIIAAVGIAGFMFGLTVLGIPVRSSNIYLLFRYGYTGENRNLQLIQYDGTVLDGPENQHFFKIKGTIFNFEKEFMPQRDFTLSFYTQDKQLLEKYQFSCCKKEFFPRKITSIEETFPISSSQVGYFELKLF